MRFLVSARADTPLAFRCGRDKGREGTLDYIPGSALRGGLASAHRRLRPTEHEEFTAFFLRDQVTFGNLYPAKCSTADGVPNPVDEVRAPVRPLPRTALSCKRFGGFHYHAGDDREERHGVLDGLLAWAAFALSGQVDPSCLNGLRDCPCGEPLDAFPGFCKRGDQPRERGAPRLSPGMFTRTGISRSRGTGADGILYSREFLHGGSEFCGEWWADDRVAEALESLVDQASDGTLRVGHNRTRGLGRLSFPHRLHELNAEDAAAIENRSKTFDARLREAAGGHAQHEFYLPVTLTSDCLLPDAPGRYRLQITSAVFREAFDVAGAELVYCNASRHLVTGWNSLWGLPKADEWAVAMGSVFLFGLPSEPDWNELAEAQNAGLGARRAEGFGAFRIADEFHWEVNGA